MTLSNGNYHQIAVAVAVLIVALAYCNSCIGVSALFNTSIQIPSNGFISYPLQNSITTGISWYGIDSNPAWYKMNAEYFDFLVESFPSMSLLTLQVSAPTIFPNIANGDYNTVNTLRLNQLRDFVSWCKPKAIKILIVNMWESVDETGLIAYWTFMAREFRGEGAIVGFDLINEPWAFAYGNTDLMQIYRNVIDSIRSVDSSRTCYFQSMFYHYEGAKLREVLEANPLNRENVVFVSHLYSQGANNGLWYDAWTSPWIPYYLAHDYTKAKQVLANTTEGYGGLYQRFGFIQQELEIPVAITEIATIDTEEGYQYITDALDILNEWEMSWTYHMWYSGLDRPISLTYPDGTLRPKAKILQGLM